MKHIIFEKVSKDFKIGFTKNKNVLDHFVSILSGREPKRTLHVVDNITFSVGPREFVGIIGENASGKSTLLRIIAGIYRQDDGTVLVNGKVVSLIDLFIGLKERLSMKDNIYLCCFLFGQTSEEIKKKYDSIVAFTELEKFVDAKVHQFSNGMKQRLISSVAIHCEPDIFLIDEDFEVGDENFKIKSASAIKYKIDKGGAALLVSHNMDSVRKYCTRVIWMEKGKIVMDGKTEEVVGAYLKGKNCF